MDRPPQLAPELRRWLQARDGLPGLTSMTPTEARAATHGDFLAQWGARDAIASVVDRVVDGVAVRVFRPAAGTLPCVVFAHGGGWVIGSVDTHDGLCRQLALDAGAVVVSVDYRLAPEAPFPAAIDDVTAALRWVAAHAGELDVDPARLSVCGDSAGGNLAAVAAATAGVPLASQVLIYPVTDHDTGTASYDLCAEGLLLTRDDMRWFLGHYAGGDDPRAAPLRSPTVPTVPALVVTCELDVLRDEGIAYARRLRAAGAPVVHEDWPGMVHGFVTLRTVTPACARLVARVVGFLRQSWLAPTATTMQS